MLTLFQIREGGRLCSPHYYLSPWIFRTSYKPGTWTFFQLSREMKWRHTFQQMDFCNSEFLMGNKWRRSESKLSPLSISLFLFSFVTSRKKMGNCRWHIGRFWKSVPLWNFKFGDQKLVRFSHELSAPAFLFFNFLFSTTWHWCSFANKAKGYSIDGRNTGHIHSWKSVYWGIETRPDIL